MQLRKGNSESRGISRLWAIVLCLLSFVLGRFTCNHHSSEYGLPMVATTMTMPPLSPLPSLEPDPSPSVIQQIAEELIRNTLGGEILGQADKMPLEELKKTFYKALSSASTTSRTNTSTRNAPFVVQEKKQLQRETVEVTTAERDFLAVAKTTGTDKVQGYNNLEQCIENDKQNGCLRKGCKNFKCRPWGHFYDTFYQSQLGHLSRDDAEPFQALEIGFYRGSGFRTYESWLPKAEMHSMEISCLPPGPVEEGKWPYGNTANKNKQLYDRVLEKGILHCGDASKFDSINSVWTEKMKRKDSPPLKLVIDDGSHEAVHMAKSLFFWFPRIEPGGYMVVEDIQPIHLSNRFRTQLMPQMMADLHYCGDPRFPDSICFPTIQPLLESIYCEMHICVFKRNDKPAQELSEELSAMPPNALDASQCTSLQNPKWEKQ